VDVEVEVEVEIGYRDRWRDRGRERGSGRQELHTTIHWDVMQYCTTQCSSIKAKLSDYCFSHYHFSIPLFITSSKAVCIEVSKRWRRAPVWAADPPIARPTPCINRWRDKGFKCTDVRHCLYSSPSSSVDFFCSSSYQLDLNL
jgi:hypothetical protein